MKVIAGNSNIPLAQNIAAKLESPMLNYQLQKFGNQELRVWVDDDVRGQNVSLVQSFSQPVDTNIMETLLLVDALERMGARHINLIIPWLGYSLQDKVFRPGEPIAAKVIANILSNSYVKRVFLMDLHNSSIPGFFAIPTQLLSAMETYANYVKTNFNTEESIIVSPDFGGLKRARNFAKMLDLDLANIDKHRDLKTGQVTAVDVHGDVQEKICLLYDDVIMSGGTVVEAAKLLKEKGAREVHFLATHGIFCNGAIEKINNSQVDSVVITNTIYHQNINHKIKVIDISHVFTAALKKWC